MHETLLTNFLFPILLDYRLGSRMPNGKILWHDILETLLPYLYKSRYHNPGTHHE